MLAKMWSNRNSDSLLVGTQEGAATLEDSFAVSYKTKHKLNICLPYNPAVILLGIYSNELKTYIHTKI